MSTLFWRMMIIIGFIALGMVVLALAPHWSGRLTVVLFLPLIALLVALWRKL